jgi:hypothetical protein
MLGERKEWEKNQTTTGNHPTTVSWHAPLYKEEDTVAHLERWRGAVLATEWCHMCRMNDADATHSLVHVEHETSWIQGYIYNYLVYETIDFFFILGVFCYFNIH